MHNGRGIIVGFYGTTDDENHLCGVSLREMSPSQGTSLHTVTLTLLSCGLEPCKCGLALTLSSHFLYNLYRPFQCPPPPPPNPHLPSTGGLWRSVIASRSTTRAGSCRTPRMAPQPYYRLLPSGLVIGFLNHL